MWELVRDRRFHGLKFRRQHVINGFIVDFYVPALRLVLELDGGIHTDPQVQLDDSRRTRALAEAGLTVLRLKNDDIGLIGLEAVLRPFL